MRLSSAEILLLLPAVAWSGPIPSPLATLPIESRLKPAVIEKVLKEREVATHASLDENRYAFYCAMLVHAPVNRTRAVMTNYPLYQKMIPYIDRANYSEKT